MRAAPPPSLLDLIEENRQHRLAAINLRMDLRTIANLIASARMSIDKSDYGYARELLGSSLNLLQEKI